MLGRLESEVDNEVADALMLGLKVDVEESLEVVGSKVAWPIVMLEDVGTGEALVIVDELEI